MKLLITFSDGGNKFESETFTGETSAPRNGFERFYLSSDKTCFVDVPLNRVYLIQVG
jgi:hypothetical protein